MQAADDQKPRAKCRSVLQGESGRRRKSRIRGAANSRMGIPDNPPEMGSVPVSIPCSLLHTGQFSAPKFFCPNRHLPIRFWLPITDVTRSGKTRLYTRIESSGQFKVQVCLGRIFRAGAPSTVVATPIRCSIRARSFVQFMRDCAILAGHSPHHQWWSDLCQYRAH